MMYTSMEVGLMKRNSCGTPTSNTNRNTKSSLSPALGMHSNSQMMSKGAKPKIRIIHIFAPEIIKTDVANFRQLVQRLTGKPDPKTTMKAATTKRKMRNILSTSSSSEDELRATYNRKPVAAPPKKLEIRTGFRPAELRERIKGEEEIWGGANSGGGFLGGFADLECGFMQELNVFPLLPLDATTITHMDAYGSESQLA